MATLTDFFGILFVNYAKLVDNSFRNHLWFGNHFLTEARIKRSCNVSILFSSIKILQELSFLTPNQTLRTTSQQYQPLESDILHLHRTLSDIFLF